MAAEKRTIIKRGIWWTGNAVINGRRLYIVEKNFDSRSFVGICLTNQRIEQIAKMGFEQFRGAIEWRRGELVIDYGDHEL